jgi:hypothetical protein
MMIRQGSLLGLLGCLLLAGCAAPSGRIAPVESRSINAPVPTVPTPTPVATPSDPAVTVTVLPAPAPARGTPRPLPSGASSATPTPPPAPAGTGATAPPPPPPQQLALATPVTKTDAVDGILRDVRRHWAAGQHEQAAAGLERALRIEPSNAYLWQHLAAVRLKSNSVAGDSAPLRLRNWRIIAEARRLGGDIAGAREAEARASTYGTGR